jgi:hypothetical protein
LGDHLGLKCRLHVLRHYKATQILAASIDLRTVAGRLGHSGRGSTTLKVYGHWTRPADQQAASIVASGLPDGADGRPSARAVDAPAQSRYVPPVEADLVGGRGGHDASWLRTAGDVRDLGLVAGAGAGVQQAGRRDRGMPWRGHRRLSRFSSDWRASRIHCLILASALPQSIGDQEIPRSRWCCRTGRRGARMPSRRRNGYAARWSSASRANWESETGPRHSPVGRERAAEPPSPRPVLRQPIGQGL